jgi:hypothetical protein
VLCAIPEEAKGAASKVQQYARTIALVVAACRIVAFLTVSPEGPLESTHEPAIGAVFPVVFSCGVKVGPADADEDA